MSFDTVCSMDFFGLLVFISLILSLDSFSLDRWTSERRVVHVMRVLEVEEMEEPRVRVRILSPTPSATLDGVRHRVSGLWEGITSKKLNVYLLVRPERSTVWSVLRVRVRSSVESGMWDASIDLGEQNSGDQEAFVIKVIATTAAFQKGETLKTNELVPDLVLAQHQVSVTRKDKTLLSIIFSPLGLFIITTIGGLIPFIFSFLSKRHLKKNN